MDTPDWHKKMAEFAGKYGGITTPTDGFHFVRHGETFYNDAKIIQPVMGSQLNANGKAQAEKAGPKLKDKAFDAYYASDQERAWMTAQIIASHNDARFAREIAPYRFLAGQSCPMNDDGSVTVLCRDNST